MYTMTPDSHPIIDTLPTAPNIAIGAGFSGLSRNLKSRYGARNRFQEPSMELSSQATQAGGPVRQSYAYLVPIAPIAGLKLPAQLETFADSAKYIDIKSTTVYCMSPRRNWDSHNPSVASECDTRLWVTGWGSPNSNDWEKKLNTLPTLWLIFTTIALRAILPTY